MKYVLAAIALLWLADGVLLLLAPRALVTLLREGLQESPGLLRWEALGVVMGLCVMVGTTDMRFSILWTATGAAMVGAGLLLSIGPDPLRQRVLRWCLSREDIDYRLFGIGLCALAVLLLHALGWIAVT